MEIIRFYKQKRILHKYVRWMYDLLSDGRFYQLEKSKQIKDLPKNYKRGDGEVRFFERMYHCADSFSGYVDFETGEHQLTRGFFCGERICPVCAIKKSIWEYSKLSWQMENFQEEYTYYFLTLTLPNNPDGFKIEINLLSSVLRELGIFIGFQAKGRFSFCEGMYGSYEITKSEHGWHPHLHLVLAYPKKYVVSTNTVKKTIKGRERVFENGLQLQCGKKTLFLSQDSIMQKYIELVKRKTDVYNERFEDLEFLNIGFQPCYNIEQGVNEMSKYLIDFEALASAEDLYIYLRDSYRIKQRVRRGIFQWTPELKAAHKEWLKKFKDEDNFYFIQSRKNVSHADVKWYYGSYIASRLVEKELSVMFTSSKKRVFVYERYRITPQYDTRGKPNGYKVERLKDIPIRNWSSDVIQDNHEYVQTRMD